jgi:hypothetical protein
MPRYVQAKIQKRTSVQCEHCGQQYNYTYEGGAVSDVGFLEFSSRKAAGRATQAAVQDESGNFHRCPGCGRYQSWMIQHAKDGAAAKGCTWGCLSALIVPLGLLGVVFGLGDLLNVEPDQMMDAAGCPTMFVLAAWIGSGVAYYAYRRFVWDPNSERARLKALRTGKLR